MKRLILITLFLLALAVSVSAQPGPGPVSQTASRFRRLTSEPTSCAPGDVYHNLTTHKDRQCLTANTWSDFGIGPGTVTSIATTSPITGGTITSTGTIACATCVTSAASLTSNNLMIGGGSQASSTTTTGTGILTALGVNIGSAGAPVLFNGAGGTPSSITLTNGSGLPTTGLTGTLQAAQEPAHTGDVTNSAGSLALAIANNAVTLAKMATQATNTVLGNATSGTAVPTALTVGTCSTAGSALIWTTNTGFGCNTSITAAAVPVGGITGLGTGVATALAVNVGTAGAFVANGGALGSPSSAGTLPAFTLGGTISGGGNQLNNIIIGTTTPLAGSFTTLSATGHTTFEGNTSTGATGGGKLVYDTFPTINQPVISGASVSLPGLGTSSAPTTGTVCWTTGTGIINVDTTTTCLLSSRKFKQQERPLSSGLSTILKLQPVSYFLKPKYNPTGLGEQLGLMAEDVAKVDSRLVSTESDGSPHAVRYQQLTAVLVKAVQEQQEQIRKMQSQIEVQQKRIDRLRRHARYRVAAKANPEKK